MGKHTFTYKITLAWLNLRGKKSCDPLFHLALFHFRCILGRRGSWWEKCCECFKMFFYHQYRTKWRSTHVKATLLRVGCVGVVGKGLYYHRFVDVPSMGNGLKWDDFLSKCVFSDYFDEKMKKRPKFRSMFLIQRLMFSLYLILWIDEKIYFEGKGIFFHF